MLRTAKPFIAALLIGAQISAPSSAFASSAVRIPSISANTVLTAQSPQVDRASLFSRFGRSPTELRAKAQAVLKGGGLLVGSSIINDVFQVSMIMFASAAAQVAHDRMEQNHLLAGYTPNS